MKSNRAFDLVMGIAGGVLSSIIYASICSIVENINVSIWITNNVVLFCVFTIISCLFLVMILFKRISKITMHCVYCNTKIEKFELIPGERIIGCACGRSYRVIMENGILTTNKNE